MTAGTNNTADNSLDKSDPFPPASVTEGNDKSFDYGGTETGRFDNRMPTPEEIQQSLERILGSVNSGGPSIKVMRHDNLEDALAQLFGEGPPCPDCDCGAAEEMPFEEDEGDDGKLQFGFSITFPDNFIKLAAFAAVGVVSGLLIRKFLKR